MTAASRRDFWVGGSAVSAAEARGYSGSARGRAFQSLMVLSLVERRNLLVFAPCLHHRILLIFSSISKLLR